MYYLVYGLLYLISLLPMPILYLFSDGVYAFLYYVIGYRKKVVMDNLAMAFPKKTDAERKRIAKDFYRNFVDNFIETLKFISAGKEFMLKRFIVDNPELYEKIYNEGRKCQLHLGHNFNWELANVAMPFLTRFTFIVVYMPLGSKIFDRFFMSLRTRTGSVMLPATEMSKSMVPYRSTQYMLALVADQSPGSPSNAYWLDFFGYPTPFVRGPERGARAGDIPVLFAYLYKKKRGYYRGKLELGSDNPGQLPEGELTRRYVDFLERNIREQPSLWLWSHRRWKHEWKEEYRNLWMDNKPPAKMVDR
ncbi:MAG TPA: lysophospholipid acyltransferase family protein [Puia sp.]|nr:lysophospholipid acyltransferase family protein [Puia sp.]